MTPRNVGHASSNGHLPGDILCIGLGSPHGDDQIGWRVIESLRREPGAKGRRAPGLHVARSPLEILDRLAGARRLVVIDACRGLTRPGELTWLAWPSPLLAVLRGGGSHDFGLAEALALAGELRLLPQKVEICGIEGETFGPGEGLSPALASALPGLVSRVRQALATDPAELPCTNGL